MAGIIFERMEEKDYSQRCSLNSGLGTVRMTLMSTHKNNEQINK